MTFINSLKSVIRTPVKTVLFIVLVAAVTAFVCLGFGMWSSSDKLIREADQTYTTIVNIEYVDEGYPDATLYSDTMYSQLSTYDASKLGESEYVLNFDRQYEIGGYIDGFESKSSNKLFDDYGVLRFKFMYKTELGNMCSTLDPYYIGSARIIEGSMIYVEFSDTYAEWMTHDIMIPDHYYIANGIIYKGESHKTVFEVSPYSNPNAPDNSDTDMRFPFWDITDITDTYTNEQRYTLFQKMVRSYNVMNNYVSIFPTSNVEGTTYFVQAGTYLVDDMNGVKSRFFTEEEYKSGARVVVLSNYIASRMNIGIGDTVNLGLYTANGTSSARCSFWADDEFIEEGVYTVVGLFKEGAGMNLMAFIPKPVGQSTWLPEYSVSYQIASLQLKNGTVDEYIERIQPYLENGMRVTAYDQGYSVAIAPILAMRETAILLALIGVICAVIVLMLFAYMYVTKQRETVATMLALGSGKVRATAYLLICVLLVSLTAAVIGATLGGVLSEQVTRAAYERAEETSLVDHTFSATYLVKADEDIVMKTDFAPDYRIMCSVGLAVVAVSLLYASIMTWIVLSHTRPKSLRAGIKEV